MWKLYLIKNWEKWDKRIRIFIISKYEKYINPQIARLKKSINLIISVINKTNEYLIINMKKNALGDPKKSKVSWTYTLAPLN